MIVKFSASNIIALILFIPLLVVLALIAAFIVPIMALIISAVGIGFTGIYVLAKAGLAKKQETALGKNKAKEIEFKDYRVR